MKLKPGIIINNRLGGGFTGDTETPEQTIPATGFKDRDWETCMTMNDTWGYKSDDHDWKSAKTLHSQPHRHRQQRRQLPSECRPDNRRADSPSRVLSGSREVGEWMKVNGQAIYGTKARPFKQRVTLGPGDAEERNDYHPAQAQRQAPRQRKN